jgi:hypothetical protein
MWNGLSRYPVSLLTLSMFTSSVGTNLLLVALSVFFYEDQQSAMAAAGVYVAQFTPVILLMPLAWRICDRYEPRLSLYSLELCSMAITLLVGLSVIFAPSPVTYALLFVRGFFDMTTKAARNVALKTYCESSAIGAANNKVTAASYFGQAVGAAAGFFLIGKLGMFGIAAIDAASYLVSALVCRALPAAEAANASRGGYKEMLRQGIAAMKSSSDVFLSFCVLTASVVFLQGFNQIARLWIPLAWLKLPAAYGAVSEVIGLGGIVAGLLLASGPFAKSAAWRSQMIAAFIGSSVFGLMPLLTTNPVGSFGFYFLYMTLFELAFMIAMNKLLQVCDKKTMPCIMVLFYGLGFGGMTLTVVLLGVLTDRWGLLVPATGLFCSATVLIAVFAKASVTQSRLPVTEV